jgi:hypothetical protein
MSIAELRSLTAFRVSARYGRTETTFDVRMPGRPTPVARLFKAGPYDSLRAFHVLTGPDLTDLAGYVTGLAAYAPDRTQVGSVASRSRVLRPARWSVEQPGLGTLAAQHAGISAVRFVFPFSIVLSGTVADTVLPFRFCFRSSDSRGFVVSRHTGLRARFTVTVHDPRLDRRLILAAVVSLNRYASSDLRQDIVDATANPFQT